MAEDENGEKSGKGGKLKTIIIVAVGLILAVGLSVVGTLWFLNQSNGEDGSATSSDKKEAETHTPASYFELDDPLTVSISGDRQRYLQANLAFVMRQHDVSAVLKQHLPTVRSRLRALLQKQSFQQLRSREGKQVVLKDMRDAVNEVLAAETEAEAEADGDGESGSESKVSIERVLLTNFVMQ